MKKLTIHKYIIASITLLLSLFFVQTISNQTTLAAYEAGRLLDNSVLLDAGSMNAGQIQSFLGSRGGQIASKSFIMDCDTAGQQAKQIYLSVGAPCGRSTSSANIIYYVAQVYGISPKVILATMQKEQSLITATNPTARQYAQAMGYACPTSGNCNDSSNFFWQVDNGTWVLRYHYERARGNMNWWRPSSTWTCGTEKNLYKPNLYPGQNVRFYDTNGTHYTTVYVQNAATSSFYCYTPHAYNNPQGLYGRAPYGHTGLYYSGSYNFITFFEQWFGSTQGLMYNGVSYSNAFNPAYYTTNNPDVFAAFGDNQMELLYHFLFNGIYEGRQGSAEFNVNSYKNRYPDLRAAYGDDLQRYVWHYVTNGKREGRVATGDYRGGTAIYNGVDYSAAYSLDYYTRTYSDIWRVFGVNDKSALAHFLFNGIYEGRQGSAEFNVNSYKNRYPDLRAAYGDDLQRYVWHYVTNGKREGRVGL